MPQIAMLTWGSHGDVVPLVALANALRQAGYQVVLGAQPAHAEFIRRHGIGFHPLGSETSVEEYRQLMDALLAEPNPRKQLRQLLREMLLPDLERQYLDCMDAIRGADIVLVHWMQLAGSMAAETLKKPCATVTLNPVGISCLEDPAASSAIGASAAGKAPREAPNLGRLLSDYLWGDSIHQFRLAHGLPPIESVSDYQYSSELNLVAVSRFLFPEHAGFAAQHQVTGFWPLSDDRAWSPAPELQSFLAHPDKPVVITFGSMDGRAEETTDIVIEAVRRLGCRAILQGGWAGLGRDRTEQNILMVDYVPHEYLFSHAACIVHHGGAGTTTAALSAGVPSVIVWYMLDQPYWGNLLAGMQLGPRPLQRLGLTAGALAERIGEAISNQAYRSRCAALSEQMAGEHGLENAVQAVSVFAAHHQKS